MSVRPLRAGDESAAYEFLARDPWANVMMMSVLREWGCHLPRVREFYGFERAGRLEGVASFARDVALYGSAEAMRALGALALRRRPLPRRIISPKPEVDAFWEVFQQVNLPVHFDRRQTLYRLFPEDLREFYYPELKKATLTELDALVESGAAMNIEELGIDPLRTEAEIYRARIRSLVERGRIYRVLDQRGVVFQTAVHSQTPLSAQIAGVYTRPDARGKGIATRALAEVCRDRLRESASCCLFVNDFNTPARRVYEKIGFQEIGEFRAIFLKEDV